MGVYFRLLRPMLVSISATRALTDVGETSDAPPVVPLEPLPPVRTGSSNNTLFLSSAVKVHIVSLINSGRSSSSFNSSRVGSLLIVESSSFKLGVLRILRLVVEGGVVSLSVLQGTFASIFTFAEREFIVFCFIGDYFSDAANSDPPPVGGSWKSAKGATK